MRRNREIGTAQDRGGGRSDGNRLITEAKQEILGYTKEKYIKQNITLYMLRNKNCKFSKVVRKAIVKVTFKCVEMKENSGILILVQ